MLCWDAVCYKPEQRRPVHQKLLQSLLFVWSCRQSQSPMTFSSYFCSVEMKASARVHTLHTTHHTQLNKGISSGSHATYNTPHSTQQLGFTCYTQHITLNSTKASARVHALHTTHHTQLNKGISSGSHATHNTSQSTQQRHQLGFKRYIQHITLNSTNWHSKNSISTDRNLQDVMPSNLHVSAEISGSH